MTLVTLTTLTTTNLGCVEIDGGAVELSWALRNFEGNRIRLCDDARVRWIQLAWRSAEDDGTGADGTLRFECVENRGVTNFVVPPGPQLLWIEPVCSGGDTPTGPFQVPAPIRREIIAGTVVTLDALLVVADECATCPDPPARCESASGAL
ncbi:MAG: hypothetical protein Tsb0020_02610 [Haliangiales bacterium]